MTGSTQALRLAGQVIAWFGACYHSLPTVVAGFLVIGYWLFFLPGAAAKSFSFYDNVERGLFCEKRKCLGI